MTLRRTIQEKQSELRSAKAELAAGRGAVQDHGRRDGKLRSKRAEFDVVKAKLSLGEIGLVSEIEAARAKLALADAEQRLREAQAALASAKANAARRPRRRASAGSRRSNRSWRWPRARVTALHVKAPSGRHRQHSSELPASMTPGQSAPEYPDRRPRLARGDDSRASGPVVGLSDGADRRGGSGPAVGGSGAPPSAWTPSPIATTRRRSARSRCWRASTSTSGWPPPKQFDLEMAHQGS